MVSVGVVEVVVRVALVSVDGGGVYALHPVITTPRKNTIAARTYGMFLIACITKHFPFTGPRMYLPALDREYEVFFKEQVTDGFIVMDIKYHFTQQRRDG